jgi:hypothetical protein
MILITILLVHQCHANEIRIHYTTIYQRYLSAPPQHLFAMNTFFLDKFRYITEIATCIVKVNGVAGLAGQTNHANRMDFGRPTRIFFNFSQTRRSKLLPL